MLHFDNLFFDLAGPLTDPAEGITNSLAYALDYLKIEYPSKEALTRHIGPPLKYTFTVDYGLDDETADLALKKYREHFTEIGIFENRLFGGIKELLSDLKKNSKKIYLATTKPRPFAERILEHFDIIEYFDVVSGSEFNGERSEKNEVIEHICKLAGITDRSTCVMIGDRKYDIEGAHQCGMPCIAVSFGYGNLQEFEKANADYIIGSVEELHNLLIN